MTTQQHVPFTDAPTPDRGQPGDSQVMALFRQWKAYADWMNSPVTDDMPNEIFDVHAYQRDQMGEEICRLDATCAEDLLIKVVVASYCDFDLTEGHNPLGAKVLEEIISHASQRNDSPLLNLFHRHMQLTDRAECADDDEVRCELSEQADPLYDLIEATPATTAAEFAAKAIVLTGKGGTCPDWERSQLWTEARQLTQYAG